jgi:hypothetical protein
MTKICLAVVSKTSWDICCFQEWSAKNSVGQRRAFRDRHHLFLKSSEGSQTFAILVHARLVPYVVGIEFGHRVMVVRSQPPGAGSIACICMHMKPHHYTSDEASWTQDLGTCSDWVGRFRREGYSIVAGNDANDKLGRSFVRAVGPFGLGLAYAAALMLYAVMLESGLVESGLFFGI